MIILHTNVFRPLPQPNVVPWLESLVGDFTITTVMLAWLLEGERRLPDGRRRDQLIRRIAEALAHKRGSRAVLPCDDLAAEYYADMVVARDNARVPISTAGTQIAAIFRAHGAACATRNVKDFVHIGVDWLIRGRPTHRASLERRSRAAISRGSRRARIATTGKL